MRVLAGLVVVLTSVTAFGQVFYEPVQHQYLRNGRVYYYGGSDPRVHETAAWPSVAGVCWGRHSGMAFHSANLHTHREVVSEMPQVYTDALPYRNAWVFGFTPDDAQNEAYANVPRYWRKSQMLRAALPAERGWVVPAQWHRCSDRGTIHIRPLRTEGSQPPSHRPVLVIPRDLLDRPLWDDPQNLLTATD
ncbi:MAG: hypothetical protein NZ561_06830 [Phycisphaerae bacterium]|nr:hypothetical protein [Phycisphaerae bacterium]MDW8263288.1 hypothetical protein [Phycisphaerales bacterium]